MKSMKAMRWLLLLSGILVTILGVYMVFTPLENLVGLALYIGITMLISGISEVASYFGEEKENRTGWVLASGILTTLFGMWAICGRGIVTMTVVLPFMFAMWIMMSGIMRIVAAFSYKSIGVKSWGWVLAMGILSTIFGFVLMFSPMMSAMIVAYMIASMFIVHGINSILLFFNIKKVGDNIRRRFDL